MPGILLILLLLSLPVQYLLGHVLSDAIHHGLSAVLLLLSTQAFTFLVSIAAYIRLLGLLSTRGAGSRVLVVLAFSTLTLQGAVLLGIATRTPEIIAGASQASQMNHAVVQRANDRTLVLDGQIGLETKRSLEVELEQGGIEAILLSSNGGYIDLSLKISRLIQEHQLDVYVVNECSSACVILALSGESLYAEPDAKFGFHRAQTATKRDGQVADYMRTQATNAMIDFFKHKNVPAHILERAENTSSDDMFYFSGEDLYREGLVRELL